MKMVIRCFTVILVFVASQTLNAQFKHQLGLNCTQFVKQFITPNNSSALGNSPYLIHYRMLRNKMNYRAGLGGTYSFTNEDNQSQRFTRNTDDMSMSARLGFDVTQNISKHWFFYYGLDITAFRALTVIETTPISGGSFNQKSIVTRRSHTWGAGGTFTFEYRINNRITLFTESNVFVTRGRTFEKTLNPDFPNSASINKSRKGNLIFNAPLNLYFSILI